MCVQCNTVMLQYINGTWEEVALLFTELVTVQETIDKQAAQPSKNRCLGNFGALQINL